MELGFLGPVVGRPGPWASVVTEQAYRSQDAAEQRVLSARGVGERLAALGADRATCDAVHAALAAPPAPGERGTRGGRALFATGGEVVLDTPLAGPPRGAGEWWSTLPRLAPLLDGVGEEPPCLVVYVSRTGADLELHGDQGAQRLGTVEGREHPVHRTGRDDWSESHFQTKVENTWEANAGEIADAVRQAWDDSGAELLLLVGDARERHSVRDRLPEPIRSATAETERGGRAPGAHSRLLDVDLAQMRAVHEEERTVRTLDRYRAGRTERDGQLAAAEGVPALVEAAREHRIDTLLVHPGGSDLGRQVWIGPDPDQVAVRSSDLRYLGAGRPEAARADDALLRSAAATGARVITVRRAEEAPAGGLGALLRWSEPVTH
jgi:hypothetical protein